MSTILVSKSSNADKIFHGQGDKNNENPLTTGAAILSSNLASNQDGHTRRSHTLGHHGTQHPERRGIYLHTGIITKGDQHDTLKSFQQWNCFASI